jgi:peptidoglycan hydrolase CwlO-like protein
MNSYLKKLLLSLSFVATCTASLEAKTFAERGRDLGQKLDDAEAKLKKEVEEAKKKAQNTTDRLKKKSDRIDKAVQEEKKEVSNQPVESETQ